MKFLDIFQYIYSYLVFEKDSVRRSRKLLKDSSYFTRMNAVESLRCYGNFRNIKHLEPYLKDEKWPVRKATIGAIIWLGYGLNKNIISVILPLLNDENLHVREQVVRIIEELKEYKSKYLEEIKPLLNSEYEDIREFVAKYIKRVHN